MILTQKTCPTLLTAAILTAAIGTFAATHCAGAEFHLAPDGDESDPGALEAAVAAERPPNFVIFFTDDQGYNDVGCYGSPSIETPNFDRMAREGTRFTDFYVQPVCGVSRAALMTGCYPIRVAEVDNQKAGHPVLHPDEITIAEVLKTRGYATALIGKWHLAGVGQGSRGRGTGPFRDELMPNAQGFDYFFGTPLHNGFTRQVDPGSFNTELMRNEELLESPTEMDLLTQKYTREAIRFMSENKDRPFFLYLAHNMPHVPLGASAEFRGKSKRGLYGDVIGELDWSLGQIIHTLKELNIERETLVIFTSDNGPWIEEPLGDYGGSADPLRGAKMQTWEGGPRVPCIMRWPGKVPEGRVCREMLTSMDLMPTFAKLAGSRLDPDRTIDGYDILPVITGRSDADNPRRTYFFYSYNHLQAVRSDRWKLVLPRPARPPWCSWSARMTTPVDRLELYDLENDIGETHDVAAEHPDVVTELMKLIESAREELGDFNRIGRGARFFDDGQRRPDAVRWQDTPPPEAKPADGGGPYPCDFTYTTAIGPEEGVTRRDPSDVIRVGDTYYVWYSKVADSPDVFDYPSGYSAELHYATSCDGHAWVERGLALGKGGSGEWDEHGVFTPNILAAGGKYHLFYTGVPRPFDGQTKTAMGVAVAQSPDGPWKKSSANPLIVPSEDAEAFDSMRVDDAAFVARDEEYWYYYKGRQLNHAPGETKMGLAIAEKPEGPYVKHPGGPLHPGHEVMVWPHGSGVASLATSAGPRAVYFAADGLEFASRNVVANPPRAPGCYRNDDFQTAISAQGIKWGISHAGASGDLYLVRFDCHYVPGGSVPPRARQTFKALPYDNAEPVGNLRFDFETGKPGGWKVVEGRFDLLISDQSSLPGWPQVPFNKEGRYHLSTVERSGGRKGDDTMTGTIESPRFILRGPTISFLVGGGNGPKTYVALCAGDGKELMRAGGANGPIMRRVVWEVGPHVGREVLLRIVDQKKQSWAHITFDDFSTEGELCKGEAVE